MWLSLACWWCVGLGSALSFFFFNDTATTEIYTLSLHDALPISLADPVDRALHLPGALHDRGQRVRHRLPEVDRKSTRLNSSHGYISYAVFCLKKKKKYIKRGTPAQGDPCIDTAEPDIRRFALNS